NETLLGLLILRKGQPIIQDKPLSSERHIFKGDNVTLSCNYSGFVNNLQWYRQYVGSRLEFLILVNENSEASEHSLRLSAKDSKEKKQVNLTISSAEVTDSALYYCALRPTVTESPEALYKNSDFSRMLFFFSKLQIKQRLLLQSFYFLLQCVI
uniref:Ig-like domain-containing protein n=1 Tax=Cyprinus carpio TaxID=7962 RepID=A0A8C2F326_CYPCA